MKKIIAMLLALAMVFALVACGSKDQGGQEDEQPKDTGSLSDKLQEESNKTDVENTEKIDNTYVKDELIVAETTSTSLSAWGTNASGPGFYEVYEMLYNAGAEGMYPVLADATYQGSYEGLAGLDHEPGTGIYKVKIYDYIKDHAGNPVTASDVAYCYNYQFKNATTSGWGDFVEATAEDATTVVFKFTEDQDGVGELLNFLCRCFIVSEKAHTESKSGLVNEMIGTGAYKMESYTSGSELTLVKNDDYWQTNPELRRQEQQANVARIVYKFIDEAAQRVVALKTGTVDYVSQMDATATLDFLDGAEFGDKFNVHSYSAKFVQYLVPNCAPESILNDVNMRLAVFNAIDQDGLITALGGTNNRIYGYVSYFSEFYDADWVDYASMDNYNTRTAVDPDVVKGYLEKAGYKGETLKLMTNAGGKTEGEVIAAQLNAVGIKCEVMALDQASYRATGKDPAAWDLDLGKMAGSEMATVWLHGFSYDNMDGTKTNNFIVDDEWNDLLNLICTEEGHTPENMQKWWEIAVENAYCMGLYNGTNYDVIPADMTYVCRGDKQTLLPGGSTYADPNA